MILARHGVAGFLIALVGCGHEVTSDPPRVQELDASPPSVVEPGERLDAAAPSCDPLGLETELEVSPENIALALEQDCFHSGEGRRKLVIEALCQRDLRCGKKGAADCRAEYEADWQKRLRPRGFSVPCADALLDAMSCLAQARCDDARACDDADGRAETTCDPNVPLPGAPVCPPLPEGRAPTKGPIPADATDDAGRIDESRVPDFIPAFNRQGEIAGYVRYCAISTGGAVPVYADDLTTLVGYMVPGTGFVPCPLPSRPSSAAP